MEASTLSKELVKIARKLMYKENAEYRGKYQEYHREYQRKLRQDEETRQKLNNKQKEYYKNNPVYAEKLRQQAKERYRKNKEILEKAKEAGIV
jgi:uncharacterized coiled-coil DUF342 family protein